MLLYKNTKAEFCRSLARSYIINSRSIYNLPRLRSTKVKSSNRRKWSHIKKTNKKQVADDIPLKLPQTQSMPDDLALLANTPAQAQRQIDT